MTANRKLHEAPVGFVEVSDVFLLIVGIDADLNNTRTVNAVSNPERAAAFRFPTTLQPFTACE
jgi:hypothetical protein